MHTDSICHLKSIDKYANKLLKIKMLPSEHFALQQWLKNILEIYSKALLPRHIIILFYN